MENLKGSWLESWRNKLASFRESIYRESARRIKWWNKKNNRDETIRKTLGKEPPDPFPRVPEGFEECCAFTGAWPETVEPGEPFFRDCCF